MFQIIIFYYERLISLLTLWQESHHQRHGKHSEVKSALSLRDLTLPLDFVGTPFR